MLYLRTKSPKNWGEGEKGGEVMPQYVIFMTPVAKGRPKFSVNRHTGRAMAHTPAKTSDAERSLRSLLLDHDPQIHARAEALSCTFDFYMLKPKSAGKKRPYPTVKPDLDNLEKLVKDACNGILWHDDAQVVQVVKRKIYCEGNDRPRIEISVNAME